MTANISDQAALVQAIDRLRGLLDRAAEGTPALGMGDAAGLIDEIAVHLDPHNAESLEHEAKCFQKVVKFLQLPPTRMRFTDIRSRSEWLLNHNLHHYTAALAQAILDRHPAWLGQAANRTLVALPANLCLAMKQCMRNHDTACLDLPLGHARRWIGCKRWTPAPGPETISAMRFIFGFEDTPACIEDASQLLEKARRSETPCSTCGDKTDCVQVNLTKVQQAIDSRVCVSPSVYELSTLYEPTVYWPTDGSNWVIKELPKHAMLDVHESPGGPVKPCGAKSMVDTMTCYRVLLWNRRTFSRSAMDLLYLWDRVLKIPVFWIDPNGGLASEPALRQYFRTRAFDYLILEKSKEPCTTMAFKTHCDPNGLKHSEQIDVESDEFKTLDRHMNNLLLFLARPLESKQGGKVLLAYEAARMHGKAKVHG